MTDSIVDKIKDIADKSLVFPPETSEEIKRFLMAWWCNKYNKPFTSPEVLYLEMETLLLEYYLSKRWDDIEDGLKSGRFAQEEKDKISEEWLKTEMGEEYHEDEDTLELIDNVPEIDETFDIMGEDL